MPTRAELMTALRNADAAGDTESAKRIAVMVRNSEQEEAVLTAEYPGISFIDGVLDVAGSIARSPARAAVTAADTALSIGRGIAGQVGGGIAGLATGALTQDVDPAVAVQQGVQQSIAGQPFTEGGRQSVQAIGEALQPVGEAMKTASQFTGDLAFDVTGSPAAGAIAATIPEAASMALGAAIPKAIAKGAQVIKPAAKVASRALKPIAKEVADISKGIFQHQSPTKQAIAKLIKEGSKDSATAKFELSNPAAARTTDRSKLAKILDIGGPKVKKDVRAIETIKQGFDESVIAAIKGADQVDKSAMIKMTNIMQKVRKNASFGMKNRPTDVVGKSLADRFQAVDRIGKNANKKLKVVVEGLKKEPVNIDGPINAFIDDLAEIGVIIGDDLKPNFNLSDVEFSPPARQVITNVIKRASQVKNPTAFTAHRFKKTIDDMVDFGKLAEGLSGKGEAIVKKLRRGVNETLREKFPEYKEVNTILQDTINAKDALQAATGKKFDLTKPSAGQKLGTDMRAIMSNRANRVPLLEAIDQIDTIAKKYSGSGKELVPYGSEFSAPASFKDNLLIQILYADELERVFRPVGRTSFQGQIDQAVNRGARAATSQSGMVDAAVGVVGKVAEKARNINEPAAFDAIRELLKR